MPPPASTTGCDATLNEVLVIGAAGKTGRAVTRALVARGVGVRAAVRAGSRGIPYAGELVRVVTLDLVTGAGVAAAMEGVEGVYHLAPNVHPDEVAIARRVAHCAVTEGVSRFAYHSVLHPDDVSMPHHQRKSEAEGAVRARLGSATVLRPAAYLQNLLGAALAGRIEVPHSVDAPFTNVDLDDVAEVAAHVLTDEGHAGGTYDLAGPERLSVRDLAEIAGKVLGRSVEAVEIPLQEWMTGPAAGLTEQARDDLAAMFRSYDREGLVGDPTTLRRLLGREPRSWRDVLA
ncbi:NmrA family NAD(P)-binding protein [Knoellia sp. CPCC 206435]|uniref:NmrA family NAD(P)-binding protein n=1 Tax=Knoellia terrae TaxID=3404797 RepID=UPI003B427DC6